MDCLALLLQRLGTLFHTCMVPRHPPRHLCGGRGAETCAGLGMVGTRAERARGLPLVFGSKVGEGEGVLEHSAGMLPVLEDWT